MTAEDCWLYLLKHAGKAEKLPDFNDTVIVKAIHRILVNRASEKLIKDQANDMVWTEEELDRLALLEVRAEERGLKKGLEKGLEPASVPGVAIRGNFRWNLHFVIPVKAKMTCKDNLLFGPAW